MAKISIIGTGAVGATTAFLLAQSPLVQDIVLVDIDKSRARGHALDIMHGVPLSHPVNVISGDYSDTENSDIVVVTVGVPEVVGESRLIPLQKNADILSQIIPQITHHSPDTILLMVSNPVDILTDIAYRLAGLPPERVIGLGTMLDTSRLRYLLSRDFKLSAENISTYVIGEHGDSQVVLWSKTLINSLPVIEYARQINRVLADDYFVQLEHEVRQTAFDVWQMKGPNAFCVAMAIKRVIQAIMGNERVILPVSSLTTLDDDLSHPFYVSQPGLISRQGCKPCVNFDLPENEANRFEQSKRLLKTLSGQVILSKGDN